MASNVLALKKSLASAVTANRSEVSKPHSFSLFALLGPLSSFRNARACPVECPRGIKEPRSPAEGVCVKVQVEEATGQSSVKRKSSSREVTSPAGITAIAWKEGGHCFGLR